MKRLLALALALCLLPLWALADGRYAGDLDQDGTLTVEDVWRILRMTEGLDTVNPDADMNADNHLNASDVLLALAVACGAGVPRVLDDADVLYTFDLMYEEGFTLQMSLRKDGDGKRYYQADSVTFQAPLTWLWIPDKLTADDGTEVPVTHIGPGFMQGNTHVEEVQLSRGIQWVGDRAFENCTALRRFSLY